jgi:DNA-directed RNA polymerase subunit omega
VARITVEDCLKRVSNRFLLANMASKRVRQIREGSEYLVSSPKNEDIVVALREIAAGMVTVVDKDAEKLKQIEAAEQAKEVEEAEKVKEAEKVEEAEEKGEDAAEAEEVEKEESE